MERGDLMADSLNIFGTEYNNVAGIIATTPNGTDLTFVRGGSVTITDVPNATGITCVITTNAEPEPTPSETWETLFEGSEIINPETTYNGFWIEALSDVPITAGSVWRITIDQTDYGRLVATDFGQYGGIIGNPLYLNSGDDGSGVPFDFVNPNWGAWYGGTELSAGTHSFKIERLVTE